MAAAGSGGQGEAEREDLSLRLAELASSSARRLLERIGGGDSNAAAGEQNPSSRSPLQWLDAAAAARSAGPRAAARFVASSGREAWEAKDARVVRAVAGLAVVAATTSDSSADDSDADDASSVAALAAVAALPRALSALRASQ